MQKYNNKLARQRSTSEELRHSRSPTPSSRSEAPAPRGSTLRCVHIKELLESSLNVTEPRISKQTNASEKTPGSTSGVTIESVPLDTTPEGNRTVAETWPLMSLTTSLEERIEAMDVSDDDVEQEAAEEQILRWVQQGPIFLKPEPLASSSTAAKDMGNASDFGNDIQRKTESSENVNKQNDENDQGGHDTNNGNTNILKLNVADSKHPDLIIKTEVKQEIVSSDEEIWIVQTASETGREDRARKGHKCDGCSKFFPSAVTLASHTCQRHGRKRQSDDEVPAHDDVYKRAYGTKRNIEYENSDLIIERQRRKAKDHSEIVTCHDCNQSFTSKVRLKFHMQFHAHGAPSSNSYACGQCDLAFDTETELFDHVHFQHDKRKRWQCPQPHCGKTFYLRATLTKHSRTHTDTRRYVCVKCGKRFFDKQTLDEHGVTHLQIKPYQCHICLKQLTRVSRLRMHVRAHRERAAPARAPACAHCRRAFRDVQDAQEHASKSTECIESFAKNVKEESDEPAVQLSPTSGLVRHTIQVIESPEPSKRIKRQVASPIAEPLLSKLTDDARSLIRIVEIDKAFRCEFCEDVFYIEEGLNKHREIHKGVKNPFTCHICKVSFATYSRCTTHKTTHGFYKRGGEARSVPDFPVVKHFLCEDCGRSYLHWTYLQVHRRMKHPNDNYQHKCTHCEMTFPNSWSLAYHRKKMHGKGGQGQGNTNSTQNYRIPCRDCNEVLPNKNALYKHRKKEHSDSSIQESFDGTNNDIIGESSTDGGARVSGVGAWACGACARRFHVRAELRAHVRTHHPRHVAVIEIHGVSPTTDEVMKVLDLNYISRDRVIEINLMSFLKGTTNIVPNCARALSLLSNVPKTPIQCPRPQRNIVPSNPVDDFQIRRSANILTSIRRPSILQRSENTHAQTLKETTQNTQGLNVQLLLQDGTMVSGDQSQQGLDDPTLID